MVIIVIIMMIIMMLEHTQKRGSIVGRHDIFHETLLGHMTSLILDAHYPGDCIARRRWVMSEKAMVTSLF